MRIDQLRQIRVEMSKAKFNKINLADYPWDQCIADQTEKYGDEETAKKVCGAIKALYASKENFTIPEPSEGESQDDYVSRCMKEIGGEDKPQDQLVAMCIATYERK